MSLQHCLPAVRAAVKAGLGVTARPVEMMSPDLRVLGAADGLPPLPDTEYLLCSDPGTQNELIRLSLSRCRHIKSLAIQIQFTPE